MEKNVVIAGYKRSPFHFANKGGLTRVRPDDLVASVVKALVKEHPEAAVAQPPTPPSLSPGVPTAPRFQ